MLKSHTHQGRSEHRNSRWPLGYPVGRSRALRPSRRPPFAGRPRRRRPDTGRPNSLIDRRPATPEPTIPSPAPVAPTVPPRSGARAVAFAAVAPPARPPTTIAAVPRPRARTRDAADADASSLADDLIVALVVAIVLTAFAVALYQLKKQAAPSPPPPVEDAPLLVARPADAFWSAKP